MEGLDCPNEARPIRAALVQLAGVKDVTFELALGKTVVTYDPRHVDEDDLLRAIRKSGFAAEATDSFLSSSAPPKRTKEYSVLAAMVLVVFAMAWCAAADRSLVAGLVCEVSPGHHTAAFVALIGAAALSWWFVLPKAWRSARVLRPDLHLLMTIAVVGAMGLGQWFEAASVAVLFGLANLLEAWSSQRVHSAVLSLFAQVPAQARLKTEGGEACVVVGEVRAGQVVLVLPGERIPLDGQVVAGEGYVDQSPITGESRHVEKAAGAEVFAGSINQDGALEIAVTRPASQSVMAQVIRLVRQGQANKSRSEQMVDRFAHYYTPVVIVLAVLLAVVSPWVLGVSWQEGIMRALVVLVISCPCALVISTPVAVVSAMTALARGGALVKSGRMLEVLAGVKVVALDKTGTLTLGEPVIDEVIALNGRSRAEVLQLASSIESRSEHSLGRAIVAAARQWGMGIEPCREFAALPGMGAVGRVDGQAYVVGNPRLLRQRGIGLGGLEELLARYVDSHHTVMVLASESGPVGILLAGDRIRPQTVAAIRELRASGLRTVMLTGDNQGTARAIAGQAQVDEVCAELLPADKVEAVARLRQAYGPVAMVGDGINDAPALASADVGIAMGTIGTDTAIQSADIALMSDNPWHLPWLVGHARKTRRTIVWNITAAVGIKVVFLTLGAAGMVNLWMAILADMGASLAVTFNGMRLLSAPHPAEPQEPPQGPVPAAGKSVKASCLPDASWHPR